MAIKATFPVSQDFNRDPEVIELRQKFGDWMGFAWLEMLAIARRNGGKIPIGVEDLSDQLAPISLLKNHRRAAKIIRNSIVGFMSIKRWLIVGFGEILIAKYLKYNRTQKHVPISYLLLLEEDQKRLGLREGIWNRYVENRKAIRRPLTEHAADLAIKKLHALKAQGQDPNEVIENAILRGWTGLFPVKNGDHRSAGLDERFGAALKIVEEKEKNERARRS